MIADRVKHLLVLLIVIGVIGALSWLVMRWLVTHEPIPESALKVLGEGWGIRVSESLNLHKV